MSEAQAMFAMLRQSADPEASNAIEKLVDDAPDQNSGGSMRWPSPPSAG